MVLQCVAVCCNGVAVVWQCVAAADPGIPNEAVGSSVLQGVAGCCNGVAVVLQFVAAADSGIPNEAVGRQKSSRHYQNSPRVTRKGPL